MHFLAFIIVVSTIGHSYAMDSEAPRQLHIIDETSKAESHNIGKFSKPMQHELCIDLHEPLIQLPSEGNLRKAFYKKGLHQFVDTTQLAKELALQEMHPTTVCRIIECRIFDYNKHLKNHIVGRAMWARRKEIVGCVLAQHPEAMIILEKLQRLDKPLKANL